MPTYDFSAGQGTELPGPVNSVTCLAGQIIVIDPTTDPASTHTLNPDEKFDAEGKGGIVIQDLDGSRVYVEYALSPNAPVPRDALQVVVGADNQPERSGFDDETEQRGVKDVMGVPGGVGVSDVKGNDLTTEEGVLANLAEDDAPTPAGSTPTYPTPDENSEAHPAITGPEDVQRGDSDSDSPTGGTGPYEDRTVAELKATAEKKGVDLDGATKKAEIIEVLRRG